MTLRSHEEAKSLRAQVEARGHRVRGDDPSVRDLTIITGGRSVRAGAVTLGEGAERYIKSRPGVKASTEDKYRTLLKHALSPWARRPVDEITRDDVAHLVAQMHADGRSPVAAFDFVRSVFRYAASAEPPLRTGNPCAQVRMPRSRGRTETFLTYDEADLPLASAGGEARTMIEVMLNTGLRIGEFLGLRVRDLHTGARPTLTVGEAIRRAQDGKPAGPGETKSPAALRTIALDTHTASLLKAHVKGRAADYHLFLNPATGEFWRADAWRKRCWEPTVEKARTSGLTKTPRIHDLRHTRALMAADRWRAAAHHVASARP